MSDRDPMGIRGGDVDLLSAGAGLLFVVLGVVFFLDALDVWEARAAVVLPVLVIGLGLALLVGALRGSGDQAS